MPWASAASRREAQRRARCSAENAIRKAHARGLASPDPAVDEEVRRRELIARPALTSLVSGDQLQHGRRLMRNVALHSDELPGAAASLGAYRAAQRGPRLEHRCHEAAPVGRPGVQGSRVQDSSAREVLTAPFLAPPAMPAFVVSTVRVFVQVPVVQYVVVPVAVPPVAVLPRPCGVVAVPPRVCRGPSPVEFRHMLSEVRRCLPYIQEERHLSVVPMPLAILDRCASIMPLLSVRWFTSYAAVLDGALHWVRHPTRVRPCMLTWASADLEDRPGASASRVGIHAFPSLFGSAGGAGLPRPNPASPLFGVEERASARRADVAFRPWRPR